MTIKMALHFSNNSNPSLSQMTSPSLIKNSAAVVVLTGALIGSAPVIAQGNQRYHQGFLTGAVNAFCMMYINGYASREDTKKMINKTFDEFYRMDDTRALAKFVLDGVPFLHKDAGKCPWPVLE